MKDDLKVIEAKLDQIIRLNERILYALLAIGGATVGLKVTGSPPLYVIGIYLVMITGLFASIFSFSKRKEIPFWQGIFGWGACYLAATALGIVSATHLELVPAWIANDLRPSIAALGNIFLLLFLWKYAARR